MIGIQFEQFVLNLTNRQIPAVTVTEQPGHVMILATGIPSLETAKKIAFSFAHQQGWTPKTYYQTFGEETFYFWWQISKIPRAYKAREIDLALESLYRLRSRIPSCQVTEMIDSSSPDDSRSAGAFISLLTCLGYEVTIKKDDKLFLVAITYLEPPVCQFALGETMTLTIARAYNQFYD